MHVNSEPAKVQNFNFVCPSLFFISSDIDCRNFEKNHFHNVWCLHRNLLLPRADMRKLTAYGLFQGALVSRGHDWRWGDQDGNLIIITRDFQLAKNCLNILYLIFNTQSVVKQMSSLMQQN